MPSAPISIASSGLRLRWVILFQVNSRLAVDSGRYSGYVSPDVPAEHARVRASSTTWPSAGRPVEFLNTDLVSPISRARSVISAAKFSSDPGHAFGDDDAAVIGRLDDHALDQILEPDLRFELGEHGRAARLRAAVRQAFSLTTNLSSSDRRPTFDARGTPPPSSSAWRARPAGSSLSASFENRIVPVSASIMMACLALRLEQLRLRLRLSRPDQGPKAEQSHRERDDEAECACCHEARCPAVMRLRPCEAISLRPAGSTTINGGCENRECVGRLSAGAGQSRTVIASGAPCDHAASQQVVDRGAAVGMQIDAVPASCRRSRIVSISVLPKAASVCRQRFGLACIRERARGDVRFAGRTRAALFMRFHDCSTASASCRPSSAAKAEAALNFSSSA